MMYATKTISSLAIEISTLARFVYSPGFWYLALLALLTAVFLVATMARTPRLVSDSARLAQARFYLPRIAFASIPSLIYVRFVSLLGFMKVLK